MNIIIMVVEGELPNKAQINQAQGNLVQKRIPLLWQSNKNILKKNKTYIKL